MKKLLILSWLLVLITGCVYPYDAALPQPEQKPLVVDGTIIIGQQSKVRISYLSELDATITASPSNAGVTLEGKSGNTYEFEQVNRGYYTLDSSTIPSNDTYRLKITCDGNTYYSDWLQAQKAPEIKKVEIVSDGNVVIAQASIDASSGDGYVAIHYQEKWKFHADYAIQYWYNPESNEVKPLTNPNELYYWCYTKRNVEYEAIVDCRNMNGMIEDYPVAGWACTDKRLHSSYTIRTYARNMTENEYRYRKLLEENSQAGGDLFTPEPGEMKGNLYCESDKTIPVYGYVNLSASVMQDATTDDRFYVYKRPSGLTKLEPEDYLKYYNNGYIPLDIVYEGDSGVYIGWGSRRCYDCTAEGGFLEPVNFDDEEPYVLDY